jgi:hypothetical protein
MTVNSTPAQPAAINGFTAVCTGDEGVVYSIDPVANADSYAWTVPAGAIIASGQGTTSITVNFSSSSGNISVVASNGCGNSIARTVSVNVTDCATGPTNVRDKDCGTMVSSLDDAIYAKPVSGATHYEFQLTSRPDGTVISIVRDNGVRLFRFNMSSLSRYNTTYDIIVRAYVNDSWTNWGISCDVSTPDYVTTKLRNQDCGKTLSKMGEGFYCEAVTQATDYWWEFTSMSDASVIVRVKGKDTRIMNAKEAGLSEGTTYSVRIRPYIDGDWRGFGANCLLTTPGTAAREVNNELDALMGLDSEDMSNTQVNIFPNPANKLMPVAFAVTDLTSTAKTVTIEVIDMFGKKVLVKEVNNNNGYVRDYLHFENTIASGTYFILIKTSEEVITKRFIIE